jgi:hypothetical protein
MGKRTLYYSDVTHKCGHTVRYTFSIANNAPRQERIAQADELKRMATEPCEPCTEKEMQSAKKASAE